MASCGVLSFLVIGYLSLIEFQSRISMRSQSWNVALSVAEAGIEEGLQHLNDNREALASDGWTFDGSCYNRSRTLGTGDRYTVRLNAISDPMNPIVEARGYSYPPPVTQTRSSADTATAPIERAVRVRCHRGSLFLAAMVAKRTIDLKGNGILSDSFDSGDPAKSTNGHYDKTKAGDKGDVASNLGILGAVSVLNANIYGHVQTGPGGSATVGSLGGVGSHAWQASNKGIQPGWATDDANFTFPEPELPYTSGLTPMPGDIATVIGYTTNATFVNNSLVYPAVLPAGFTLSPITTNVAYYTVSTYPGSRADLTTNQSFVTVTDYPGAMPGLVTNYTAFTTVSDYPGAQPGLFTNITMVSVSSYPGSQPLLSTNITHVTGANKPPPEGAYIPGTLFKVTGKYTYDRVDGYSYAIYSYTYSTAFSYTYLALTYTYPEYAYSYTLYESSATYTTNHYDHVLMSGDYVATSLSGTVYAAGQARLVLPNGLAMSGNDTFILGPNGSLEVYADGPSMTIGGNGVINPSGFAGNFILYSTANVIDFTLNGNGEYTGVLVAPEANVTMNGGGNANLDFTGCLMVNSVGMNGLFKFHYDEALGRMPAKGRYLITSWDEIQ